MRTSTSSHERRGEKRREPRESREDGRSGTNAAQRRPASGTAAPAYFVETRLGYGRLGRKVWEVGREVGRSRIGDWGMRVSYYRYHCHATIAIAAIAIAIATVAIATIIVAQTNQASPSTNPAPQLTSHHITSRYGRTVQHRMAPSLPRDPKIKTHACL